MKKLKMTDTSKIIQARTRAYYSYLSYSRQTVSDRGIEKSLLACTGTPKLSDYGLEENSFFEGWWYTGVDEEKFDEIVDNCTDQIRCLTGLT